ncbi:unnamed protein product [Periconia digitata]|uniref:DOMON domain-containing protein n=1 Tax=Periconia digitata TaxID=1303443 RepID=A0A9W4USP5_9PLEO|nr:unnamed protein product [Periconia digitata]
MSSSLNRRCATLCLLLLAFFTSSLRAQNTTAASTFYLPKTETQFSFNLANNSNDVFIYLTSPAYSWVGVGFGESMKNALMLIVYPNSNGNNVTVSPRVSTDNTEPTFSSDVKLDILPGTGITDEMFVLKARCRSCRVWPNGFLDADSTTQPMVYAFGPAKNLNSDRPDAPLKRHYTYGKFTMNMREAVGTPGVPAPSTRSSGVSSESPLVKDHDRKTLAHAIIGCLAIFVLWPINIILAGFLRNIKIHIGFSIGIMVFIIVSYALGIAASGQYNRSKAFNSPHQIFAFLAILPILLLSLLPMKPLSTLKQWIPRAHAPLATLCLTLLILTGGLGLHLSSSSTPIILTYLAISILVFSFITLLQLCVRRRGSAYARATTRRRLGDEDEQDYGLANYWARRKLEGSRSQSQASSNATWDSERPWSGDSRKQGGGAVFGGGTMPGPHYMMNMHPGVPVSFK